MPLIVLNVVWILCCNARAMERATQLILAVCGGEPGPVTEAVAEQALPKRPTVGLRPYAAKELLGEAIDEKQCVGILTRLGLEQVAGDEDIRHFNVPSHRFDISLEADLIEEIARIYGYRNIKSALPPANLAMRKPDFRERLDLMRRALVKPWLPGSSHLQFRQPYPAIHVVPRR